MRPVSMASVAVLLVLWAGLWGCIEDRSPGQPKADAVAVLAPTRNSEVGGVFRFARTDQGVRVMARITHLAPGPHGVHIHEFGDCRANDAASAGAHYNPGQEPHGGPDSEHRHAGDLGNVRADANGVALLDLVAPLVQLDGSHSVIGRSVVVHAEADDLSSQPAGAAGARLACGVIGWAGP